MAFPTNTTVLDNFNRANNATIGSTTASSGCVWGATQVQNSNTPGLLIDANRLYVAGINNNAYLNQQFGPDSEVYLDVSVLPVNGGYIGLYGRLQTPGSGAFDCYALIYIHATAGSATWSLRRYDNGSSTVLSNISATALSAGDSLGLEITGTGGTVTVSAYRKTGGTWSSIGSANDTSGSRITSAGYLGLELEAGSNATEIDNLSGGTVVTTDFPTNTTVIDNFNRSDTLSLGGSTTSSGLAWSTTQLQNSTSVGLGILSNRIYFTSNFGNNAYITTPFGPDTEVYVDVTTLPNVGEYLALWARMQNVGSGTVDCYALIYIHDVSGTATWSLRRYDDATPTFLSNVSADTLLAGDSIGFSVTDVGSAVTLTSFRKTSGIWSQVTTVDDSSGSRIAAAGYIGVELGETTARLDNLSGGTVVTNFPANTTIIDNFNRADVNGIGGSITSSGAVWASTMIQNSSTAGLQIDTFQLRRNGGSDNGYINVQFGPDCELYIDVPVMLAYGRYLALFSRIQLPGSSSFSAYGLVCTNGSTPVISLRRYESGSFTLVGGNSFDIDTLNDGDSLGFRVTGTGASVLLEAFHQTAGIWQRVASISDTSGSRIVAAGYLGVEVDSSDGLALLDNLGGGTIGVASYASNPKFFPFFR